MPGRAVGCGWMPVGAYMRVRLRACLRVRLRACLRVRLRACIRLAMRGRVPANAGVLLLAASLAAAGCVMQRTGVAAGGDPMTVTEDQIPPLHVTDAYQIVAKTHADFLHSRGRESLDPSVPPTPVGVYVNDTFYGGVETLRGIAVGEVAEIRFWQSYEAQYKFGSGHLGGVIQVITKR